MIQEPDPPKAVWMEEKDDDEEVSLLNFGDDLDVTLTMKHGGKPVPPSATPTASEPDPKAAAAEQEEEAEVAPPFSFGTGFAIGMMMVLVAGVSFYLGTLFG